MEEKADAAALPSAGWRLKLGAALFGLSIVGPVTLVPLVAAMGLSAAQTATFSGAILGSAEVMGVAAVAVMGKSGYTFIKGRVFAFLRQYGPPRDVGRTRYTIGLVLFAIPVLFGWLSPYAGSSIPGYEDNVIAFAVGGDVMLLTSLFVLGGDFWDKIRALFIYDARVAIP